MAYGLKLTGLVHQHLGFPNAEISKLDLNPPDELLKTIAARTGTSLETVQKTTLAGLLQHILFRSPEECSVLFALCDRSFRSDELPLNWEQWIRLFRKRPLSGCRSCLSNYPDAGVLLAWRLPVMLSCPIHGLLLEPVRFHSKFVKWHNHRSETAPQSVSFQDKKTWIALTNGYVDLPAGRVSAFSWFQGLGTILAVLKGGSEDPKSLPEAPWKEVVRNAAYDLLDGMPWKLRFAKMDAMFLASAISLMEQGAIDPVGLDAGFSLPQLTRQSLSGS